MIGEALVFNPFVRGGMQVMMGSDEGVTVLDDVCDRAGFTVDLENARRIPPERIVQQRVQPELVKADQLAIFSNRPPSFGDTDFFESSFFSGTGYACLHPFSKTQRVFLYLQHVQSHEIPGIMIFEIFHLIIRQLDTKSRQ